MNHRYDDSNSVWYLLSSECCLCLSANFIKLREFTNSSVLRLMSVERIVSKSSSMDFLTSLYSLLIFAVSFV